MDNLNLGDVSLPLKFYLAKLIEQGPAELEILSESGAESIYTMENSYYNTKDYMLFGNFRPISKFLNEKNE